MLDPKSQPSAAVLNWYHLEPVLRLADKYDITVLRVLCVSYMACNQADIKLEESLTSPKNPLIAATLMEQCCAQPELDPYVKPVNAVVNAALTAPTGSTAQRAFMGKLRALVTSPLYMKLVSPGVQARVMSMLVSVMDSVMAAASVEARQDYQQQHSPPLACAECC
ncbi:hypothetical protein HYH03_015960 [Edaphochlamys debaryana]|uniref:Uncharacterized protein n=1 Tax=Edaphochlamys debaryana TaxID=47281 RepID=A0A835XQR9_9CHLO|nr:hypothetical protein HYH03_015960 [Edaphochlamys debaryana]|eukprot:KAG2485285.1 hypothetical protein HYH03_015960 [Edaphochlamys debaryana]